VHKSYIVSKEKVQSILGNMLEIQAHKIPVSRGKRDEVVQAIFNLSSPGSSKDDTDFDD